MRLERLVQMLSINSQQIYCLDARLYGAHAILEAFYKAIEARLESPVAEVIQ